MKTLTFETREEWLSARRGRITGTRLKDIIVSGGPTKDEMCKLLGEKGKAYNPKAKKEELQLLLTVEDMAELKSKMDKKIGFFEVIAERLSTDPYGEAFHETPMERGTRLEPEAMAKFVEDTKSEVDRTIKIWVRDDNEGISISPDGTLEGNAAVECKCLSSARHIEAAVKKFFWKRSDKESVPDEYFMQAIQYFIVNDALTTLYMVFYDPRMITKDYFYLTLTRADVQKEVDEYLAYERKEIKELDEIVNFFSF